MLDRIGRDINYLRISVTDRCNLRCRYCMPPEGHDLGGHHDILNLEEIARLVRIASYIGIKKVRLTGGEPLLRRNIVQLVRYIKAIPDIDDIAVTTNGIFLPDLADDLKQAGLNRVNISLDTFKADRYSFITRGGELNKAVKGMEAALEKGLDPVKLNTVLVKGFNDDEIMDFCQLTRDYPVHIRFIEFMPVGELEFWEADRIVKNSEVLETIQGNFEVDPEKMSSGGGPAKYYRIKGARGTVGFISPMSNHFCHECNRLRLTADGRLRACLYDGTERDLKNALREGASDKEIEKLIMDSIAFKPEKHAMGQVAWGEHDRKMFEIGG